jgi:DNA-binding MarR family transcriptional regulator
LETDTYRKLYHSLKSLLYQIENCDRALFSKYNLTTIRYDIMRLLLKHPGINYIDLSKLICCTKGNTSCIISKLIQEGLITRKDNPEDRRSYYLHLTQSGKKLLKEVDEAYLLHIQETIQMLDTDQLEAYTDISIRMREFLFLSDNKN